MTSLSKAYQVFVMRLLFQVLLAGIFPPVSKSSKPVHSVMSQVIQKFRGKEGKKRFYCFVFYAVETFYFDVSKVLHLFPYQITLPWLFASSNTCLYCMKNKQNHSRVTQVFFKILMSWRGKKRSHFSSSLQFKVQARFKMSNTLYNRISIFPGSSVSRLLLLLYVLEKKMIRGKQHTWLRW